MREIVQQPLRRIPARRPFSVESMTRCTAHALVSAARKRSGRNGTERILTPVASNTALASAAATGAEAASPAP